MKFNYKYNEGNIPILILSIHGGKSDINCEPRKKIHSVPRFVKSNDLYTGTISDKIYSEMKNSGYEPYLLINNIHRKYVDLNRMIDFACDKNCLDCKRHYYLFHSKLSNIVAEILNKYNKCLIFDVHGNKHSFNMLQLGYHITLSNLKKHKLEKHSWTSLRDVNNKQLENYILGKKSLSYYLQKSLKDIDTSVYPNSNNLNRHKFDGVKTRYYSGTKTVMMNYKDICDVNLVELSLETRKNKKTPSKIAKGLIQFYKNVYKTL